ncbi:MAG: putative electron transport protein, partial [uncultured Blastococcus sp.]
APHRPEHVGGARGRWKRDPGQPGRGRSDGRGGARRRGSAQPDRLLVREPARDAGGLRLRRRRARALGLPALRTPGRAGRAEPAAGTPHGAVQDPPGLRPRAAQRRRRRRSPPGGPHPAAPAPRGL